MLRVCLLNLNRKPAGQSFNFLNLAFNDNWMDLFVSLSSLLLLHSSISIWLGGTARRVADGPLPTLAGAFGWFLPVCFSGALRASPYAAPSF
jgi:hypothetical protein